MYIINDKVYRVETREKALDILQNLREIADDYGWATRADLADLCDLPSKYNDNKFGWTREALTTDHVGNMMYGDNSGYMVVLPRATIFGCVEPAKITYKTYEKPAPKITPKALTITVDYAGIDEDDFDHVLAKVFQYAQTITDREVEINIC